MGGYGDEDLRTPSRNVLSGLELRCSAVDKHTDGQTGADAVRQAGRQQEN